MRKRTESLWAIRPEAALTVVRLMSRDMNASAAQPALGSGNVQMLGTPNFTPTDWAKEAVESALASHRLPHPRHKRKVRSPSPNAGGYTHSPSLVIAGADMPANLNLTAAVFANREEVVLIWLDDDAESATADVASRGFSYAGCIAVVRGEPKVTIEPGCEASVYAAGTMFASRLGPKLKAYQLAN